MSSPAIGLIPVYGVGSSKSSWLGMDMSDQEARGAETSVGDLSDAERMLHYDANKKSTFLAFIIWFFFAVLAGHRFYLERYGSAVAMLLIWVVGAVLFIAAVLSSFSNLDEVAEALFVIAIIDFVVLVVWILVDLFLIPGLVRRYNHEIVDRL
jgi:TM2 domain-containing membrane protein YozV